MKLRIRLIHRTRLVKTMLSLQPQFAAKYYFDTEFQEREDTDKIEFISVGITTDDGRDFYAVSNEYDDTKLSPWVKEHVIKKLGDTKPVSNAEIRDGIKDFVGDDPNPQFYAKCGAYDWFLLARLFGGLLKMPSNFPKYFHDVKAKWDTLGRPQLPPHPGNDHNALADAKWDKLADEFLDQFAKNKNN